MHWLSRIAASLLTGVMILPSPRPLDAANCAGTVEAVATPLWRTITPPNSDAVVVYLGPYGWVGLNHIYAVRQALRHRRRSLLPWVMPEIVTTFPFAHAVKAPANRGPVFYIDHAETAAYLAGSSPQQIHLVRLKARGKEREMAATSGASVLSFAPGLSSHQEISLSVHALSSSVLSIQPEQPLANGEYLIFLGPVAASGFEFQMNCLGDN